MFRNLVKGYLIRVARKIVSRLHKPKSCRCRVKKGTKLVNSSISKLKAQTVRQISSSFITPTVLLCRVAANTKSTKSYHHDQRRRAGGQLLPPREQPKWLYIHWETPRRPFRLPKHAKNIYTWLLFQEELLSNKFTTGALMDDELEEEMKRILSDFGASCNPITEQIHLPIYVLYGGRQNAKCHIPNSFLKSISSVGALTTHDDRHPSQVGRSLVWVCCLARDICGVSQTCRPGCFSSDVSVCKCKRLMSLFEQRLDCFVWAQL